MRGSSPRIHKKTPECVMTRSGVAVREANRRYNHDNIELFLGYRP